jgi:protein-disulfide isomerase
MKSIYSFLAGAVLLAACNGQSGAEGSSNAPLNVEPVKPPQGGDWSQIISQSQAGGFLMGNPQAAVKLVEYGSMTCPHCAEFDEAGVPQLIDKYVKTGQVSFEFRNYVRDPFDLAASLIARCNGEKSFFPLTRAMFEDQQNWIAKLQTVSPEQQQRLTTLPPSQQFVEIAKLAGFQQWAAKRGVPTAKSTACLSNEAEVNRLVQMNSDATTAHPDFKGTPAFTINGELVDGASWQALEPELRKALSG